MEDMKECHLPYLIPSLDRPECSEIESVSRLWWLTQRNGNVWEERLTESIGKRIPDSAWRLSMYKLKKQQLQSMVKRGFTVEMEDYSHRHQEESRGRKESHRLNMIRWLNWSMKGATWTVSRKTKREGEEEKDVGDWVRYSQWQMREYKEEKWSKESSPRGPRESQEDTNPKWLVHVQMRSWKKENPMNWRNLG